ncbi:MAG: malate dehydrogenase [Dehalococcoidales bacterium]|nr:malate dehydrogenase [Dehalococcoidales bacterium]
MGAASAQRIVERGYAEVVLLDIVEGLAPGKALDILQSAPVLNAEIRLTGTSDYKDIADSELVIVTAGLFRKPGMTRDELLLANTKIVSGVIANIVKYSPQSIILMVSNPLDAMTYLAVRASRFPRQRVVGMSGVLDSARLSTFVAAELKVSPKDVSAWVLGAHGLNMVVIPRLTTVRGKPLTELLPKETIDRLVERTIHGGREIVDLLKTGSAFYAPSAGIARMAEAIVLDKKEVLPCAACLDGEYGIKDSVIGVPVKLGKKGIAEIIELELSAEEKQALHSSAEGVRELIKTLGV